MKKIYLALVMLIAGTSAQAQRQCDIELVGGVVGTTFTIDASASTPTYFDLSIKNNGPDDLTLSDTIFFGSPFIDGGTLYRLNPITITAGTSALLLRDTFFFNAGPDDGTYNFCDTIWFTSDASDMAIDPNVANDKHCQSLTVVNTDGTAISEILSAAPKTKREQLAIFPNPATQTVKFDFTAKNNSEVVAYVFDVTGRQVMNNNYGKAYNGQTDYSLNIANLTNGIYFVEIRQDGVRAVGKLNKQ